MMKSIRFNVLLALLTMVGMAAQAVTYTAPKREFRSAWVATVWCLDWPETQAYGNNAEQKQKAQLNRMLDSLKNNNFNAINFQVRSMCDAMYESSYEPWSSYLTGTRGQVPTWDPLAYAVEECHKRGMECHAWINPYRYSSNGIDQWDAAGNPKDMALRQSGLLLSAGNYVVLDPARDETIERIVNVCKEIITKYDVDGILYDDYFYPDGIPGGSDAGDYQEWLDSGTDMTFGDWRRDNVNRMVKAVYDMIQETRPDIRYGISPAGVAGTSAPSYGLPRCPAGSDWQYNTIYSDPLAWLNDKTIDYISPQVYWKIGATADYSKIVPWWNQVCDYFDRQLFVSNSISGLSRTSTELDHEEYANEVELNRTTSFDGAPGAIFYSCKYLYRTGNNEELATYLHRKVFTRPALPPAMPWKPGTDPGIVTNLTSNDHVLTWTGFDNHKYSIYAVPNSVAPSQFNKEAEFLLDVSYSTQYTLPDNARYGYYYAVCPIDRMDNEFEAAFLIPPADQQLDAPVLISPENGELVPDPFTMSWNAVPNAQGYMVELSTDAEFTTILRQTTTSTSISSAAFGDFLPRNYYWRVRACAEGYVDGVSEVRWCTPQVFIITYPENGAQDIHPSFTAEWLTGGSDAEATLEIAKDDSFEEIVFSGTSTQGAVEIPKYTLMPGTYYYMRVHMNDNGNYRVTSTVTFKTEYLNAEPPTFAIPTAGGTLYSDQYVTVNRQEAAISYTIEISTSATTWGRTRFVETVRDFAYHTSALAGEIKVNNKFLEDGKTYYARARAAYSTESGTANTPYGEVISFVYSSANAPIIAIGDVNCDNSINAADVTALYRYILNGDTTFFSTSDVNEDGSVNAADVTAVYKIILGN
jgi:uncharacterized lipoprotein YddW (UPF0748 family)